MKKKKQINKPDPIFINLYKPGEFEKFFKGFFDLLQKNQSQRKVIGKNYSYQYYTCGESHDPRKVKPPVLRARRFFDGFLSP